MADSQINGWSVAPYFLVPDVVLAADYYRDKLGFSYDRFWGEPPCFCMVRRHGVVVMLSQTPNSASVKPNGIAEANDAWDAYIWVEDADALHAEFLSRGANIARGLCDQEYGCRDFDVLDLNGYRLCFGQDLHR
jgi:uncharacterized glyoxalase superfamily protein PhnB